MRILEEPHTLWGLGKINYYVKHNDNKSKLDFYNSLEFVLRVT